MLGLWRAIKFAIQNFSRNIWLSLVTVIILALALFVVNLLVGVQVVADQSLNAVRSRVDISVFFAPDAPESQIAAVKERLEKLPEVASVTFVSKEDALRQFRESTKDEEIVQKSLEAVQTNPLQASLNVKAKNLDQYPQILAVVHDPTYAKIIQEDQVVDSKITFIQRVSRITNNLSRIGFGLSVIFSIIAALVMFNTIRITIYAYREEIGIMKLVGASNAFIRSPFIIESIFYGLIASILALAVLWGLLASLTPFLNGLLESYQVALADNLRQQFVSIFGPQVVAAILLSMFSSAVAVGRYLRI